MKSVIAALIIGLCYIMIMLCDRLDAPSYYLATSIVYGITAMLAAFFAVKKSYFLLMFYALCNLLSCIFSVLVSVPDYYAILRDPFWYSTLNLSLITEFSELLLLLDGALTIAIALLNSGISSNIGNNRGIDCMASIK